MAQKKRRRKPARSQADEPYPGWMWMLFGLAIGLSVAGAIYMKDRGAEPQAVAQAPASMSPPPVAAPPAAASAPETAAGEPAEEEEPRFSFYNMLPNFEVIIPEEEPDVRRDTRAAAVERPGTYVLQAGSFTTPGDADRRRAELALLGVESRVQTVSIDRRTYYRVRIGPMSDLGELNRIRDRLKTADIDALRIRLGD